MLAIYASTFLVCAASVVLGRAILTLLGQRRPAWLSAATGFAALVVVSPFLLRLPGRATTAAVLVGLAVLAAAVVVRRDVRRAGDANLWQLGVATFAIVVGVATLPFLISDQVGVLGQGVYTNDHAAQLYWADWLQHGFGPEPSAVRFGYPIGPQAVAVIAAQVTGTTLVSSFNGLLLAIPALTALTALGGLAEMPTPRRIAIASLTGLPYLAASFMAQSAFKETAMALFVLAFALALQSASRASDDDEAPPRWRVLVAICLLLAAASVFTFSVPGLAWFLIAVPLWLVLEARAGRSPVNWRAVREGIAAQRVTIVVATVILIALAVVAFSPARDFVSKIGDVQNSAGRLSSPVFPGEALSIWPAGDFRIVRGEVSGALLAVAFGALAAGYGVLTLWRRRQFALLAMVVAGGLVYVGARAFAEIHVQAKALIVIAPLVLFIGLRALLAPPTGGERRNVSLARYALGLLVFVTATLSTLLALRDAPIGFNDRQVGLERLAAQVEGKSVAFLGVDRFAGYYLRGSLARAPAGYVPEEIAARPEKTWQQGLSADFDTLDSGQLDKFDYAITTTAAYNSTAPPNFAPVGQSGDYVLWKRSGQTPRSKVLADERGNPGAIFSCSGGPPDRQGEAVVLAEPALAEYTEWKSPAPPGARVAGQERGWRAPGTATIALDLPAAGRYALSLQYHSQVPLTVLYQGQPVGELPPSVDGMYLSGAGRGAFWPVGEIVGDAAGPVTITVRAAEPGGLAGTLDARRLVWLGNLAASPAVDPKTVAIADACGRYVDHYSFEKLGGGG
jgi:hypothetical protein